MTFAWSYNRAFKAGSVNPGLHRWRADHYADTKPSREPKASGVRNEARRTLLPRVPCQRHLVAAFEKLSHVHGIKAFVRFLSEI
jgi:hypothetical protein